MPILPYRPKQGKRFLCLCAESLSETRFHRSNFSQLTNILCGCPVYTWLSLIFTFVAIISVSTWLLVAIHTFETRTYLSVCKLNSDCNTKQGLICAKEDNLCQCPVKNTKNRCDCQEGQYWNGHECTSLIAHNQSGCAHAFQCEKNKRLVCLNNTCVCKVPMQWNSSLNACNYVYQGCFFENNTFWNHIFYSSIRAPKLFADICIERCYDHGIYTHAALYFHPLHNITNCACFSSPILSTQASTCLLLCPGNTRPQFCGTANEWRNRSFYKLN